MDRVVELYIILHYHVRKMTRLRDINIDETLLDVTKDLYIENMSETESF
jgi:hypothetical protein